MGGGFSPSLSRAGSKGIACHRGDDNSASCNRSTSLTVQTTLNISIRSPNGSLARNMAVASASTASSRPSCWPARSAAYFRKASMQPALSASQPRSVARFRQMAGQSCTSAASSASRSAAVRQSPRPIGRMASSKRGLPRDIVRAMGQRRVVAQQQRQIGRLAQARQHPPRPLVVLGKVGLHLQQGAGGHRKTGSRISAAAVRPIA